LNWFRRVGTRFGGREGRGVVALRAAMVLLAIVVAYHNSLLSLIRNLAADTPLAYLGLVPFIALGLAFVQTRRRQWEPDVHDRYVDYIVGLPLIIGTLVVVLAGPVLLSTFFWSWRLDLLTLPLFAAGAVTLMFGLRTTARLKLPIAFLLLAWPLPYAFLLSDWVQTYSDATIGAMRRLMSVMPVALPIEGLDGSIFQIQNANERFVVSVGSACAGVNGSLGFLLVGGALAGIVRGRFVGKIGWLISGMVLTWALNIVRILLIFVAGATMGQDFAIDALHPFVGLVTFNLGILAMILALPLFGLRLQFSDSGPVGLTHRNAAHLAGTRPVRPLAVRRSAVALAVVVVAAILAGSANADRDHELLIADMGQPRLGAFSPALAPVEGWTASLTDSYPWVRQYFGSGSRWNRYTYLSNATTANAATGPVYVTVDVISTLNVQTFATYGLEACYGFHNYRLLDIERSDVGAGVVAKSIVYYNPSTNENWTAMYWEWPIQTDGHEEYERIVLNVSSAGTVVPPPSQASSNPIVALQFALASILQGDARGDLDDPKLIAARDLLLGFGREMVSTRSQAPPVTAVR
jgi:exosortase/archaeosortase family protein